MHAIRTLGHDVLRAEDFGASPDSPQRVCLAGVRTADVVVLLMGARYGDRQESGLSATHEEYREARERCPVLVFVRDEVEREPGQEVFLQEVGAWSSGQYTARFSTADQLRDAVTRELHRFELARAARPVDEAEMRERALELVPASGGSGYPAFCLVVVGPEQQILQPAELEDPGLAKALMQEALFGPAAVLDPGQGTHPRVEGHALILEQDRRSVLLDEAGSVRILQPAYPQDEPSSSRSWALIHEEMQALIETGLRFAGAVFDKIDPVGRMSDVLPVAGLLGARYMAWRTRAAHQASPNSVTMGGGSERIVVGLRPAARNRAALSQNAALVAQDLCVLLRREMQPG